MVLRRGWCFTVSVFDFECECEDLPVRRFAAGDVIIEEGGRSGFLYFLIEGKVVVSRNGTAVAEIDSPGAVLGEVSILLDRPHTAEVRAAEDCSFHIAEDPDQFLHDHPKVSLYIARSLAKKVDLTTCYLVDLKQQYGGEDGQFGMMHEVIDSLLQVKH